MKNLNEQKSLINEFIVKTSKESGKNSIFTLTTKDEKNDLTKFNNLIKLGHELTKSLLWFENFGSTSFKEFTGVKLNKADFFELFFDLKKAWCYRLIQAVKIAPETISNYLQSTKNPTIIGLLSFVAPEKSAPEKSELTLTFNEKKLQIRKGNVKTNLSLTDIEKLIIELQKIKLTIEQ